MSPRIAPRFGWTVAGAAIAIAIGAVWITATHPASPSAPSALDAFSSTGTIVAFGIVVATFAAVGAMILSRQPDNGVGWLFVVIAAVVSLSVAGVAYGYRGLVVDPGSLVGAEFGAWISDILFMPLFAALTVFLFILYPDGRITGRSERRIAVVAKVGVGMGVLGSLTTPELYGYPGIGNPLGLGAPNGLFLATVGLGAALTLGATIAATAQLVRRYRRSTGRAHDQLRVLLWSAVVGIVLLMPSFFSQDPSTLLQLVGLVGVLLIPVSVGIAILRHRLFDIDLVVRRAFVFGLLATFITVVYLVIVIAVPTMLAGSDETRGYGALPFVAAAVIALAFQPVRRWTQQLAARVVYGQRATPYEVLHEFSERVAGAYGTEDVLPRMATIIGQGTGADRAQVWPASGAELRPSAVWPAGAQTSKPRSIASGTMPEIDDVSHSEPVLEDGELLGALTLTKSASDPISPTDERLLGDLAHQAGLVLRNVRLVENLRASRQRLVAAQDEERRRIERNIHDGAQQQLVALQVKQRLAEQLTERNPAEAGELLRQLQADTAQALDDLRDLARGIYPPLLADMGLAAALEAQAKKSPLPVRVSTVGEIGRLPQEVEAAVYFCFLEALQNVAKYAHAGAVEVVLRRSDETVSFEVRDDGAGFDPVTTPRGSGLQNLADRLDALGGRVNITSSRHGTTVAGQIPIADVSGHPG